MKLLVLAEHLGIVGGVETYLRAVLPLLAERFEVRLRTIIPAVGAETILDGTSDIPLSPPGDHWRPDVAFSHGLSDPNLEADIVARYPTVLFAHNYHGTCVSGTKCRAFPSPTPCNRVLGPGCLVQYLPRRCGGLNPRTMIRLYRTQTERRRTLPRYRAIVVASRHMAAEYRRHAETTPVELAPLFPPGRQPDADPPTPQPMSGRVLLVGRLTQVKGGDHLIAALPRAAERLGRALTLVVAGDGPERARLERLARRAGLPAEFLGWVSCAVRDSEMRRADMLAVPSVWPEPFGLVGLEAGCFGVPAVGYAVGGIPDWLVPGVSGESAPGDWPNPQGLADALVRALADIDHHQRLRVGAWKTARRFTPDAHVAHLDQILTRVAGVASPC